MKKDIYINEEEMGEFIFDELLKKGYVPTSCEVLDIAEIFFDYLLKKEIIEMEE